MNLETEAEQVEPGQVELVSEMTKRATGNGNVDAAKKGARGEARTREKTSGTVKMVGAGAVGVVRGVRVSKTGKEAGERVTLASCRA